MKEVGDGCDASDVDGAGEAGEDALEELPGEVEEAEGRRRAWRSRGGGGGGEGGRVVWGGHREEQGRLNILAHWRWHGGAMRPVVWRELFVGVGRLGWIHVYVRRVRARSMHV